ncbi:MAG: Rrf2 family transcriptional regulator [Chitinivibrionales bacterium]|nr:Rrf2 family transcriptional regulator [Chitinivibrionales bacterium]
MKLSTKCRYGLRAMVEIAKVYGRSARKRKDISKTQGISHGYLENILIALKSARLITTVRGASGGFSLALPPASITLYEIVGALEGSISPVECVENPTLCDRASNCVARTVWEKLHNAQKAVLTALTLADLLEMEQKTSLENYSI